MASHLRADEVSTLVTPVTAGALWSILSAPTPVPLTQHPSPSLGDVSAALSRLDCGALFFAALARIEWSVWDRTSPVNGVPAAVLLKRPDLADPGDIVLVSLDGATTVIQPVPDDAPGYARQAVADLASAMTFESVMTRVREMVGA